MSFTFSAEQEELRQVVRSFLEDKAPENEVRRLMATGVGYDPAVWRQMADQIGLQGLVVPEEFGGGGFSFVELGIVLEELGRSLACVPFFATAVLATHTLLGAGDEGAQKDYLPGIAAGTTIATVALVENSGRLDPGGITCRATRRDDGWRLDGVKTYVLDGHAADLILVAARTSPGSDPNGVTLFAVDSAAAGLTRAGLDTMDQTRKQARLTFQDTPAVLVGREGEGWRTVVQVLDTAAVGLAAEQVGGAARALEMAVDYAKIRSQFGRPIGSFQAIKHKLADMLLDVESARSVAYHGLRVVAERGADSAVVASVAKTCCSDAYFRVAAENIQIHGGIGFTWEHPAHLYFKRAKSSQLLFGDPTYHRFQLAERLAM